MFQTDLPTKRVNWNRLLISLAAEVSEWAVSVPDAYFIPAARRVLVINCHSFLTSVFLLGGGGGLEDAFTQPFSSLRVERMRGRLSRWKGESLQQHEACWAPVGFGRVAAGSRSQRGARYGVCVCKGTNSEYTRCVPFLVYFKQSTSLPKGLIGN